MAILRALLAICLCCLTIVAGQAQDATNEAAGIVASWRSNDETCRSQTATALASVAACEQRDTMAKRLMQLNYCQDDKSGAWKPCPGASTTPQLLANNSLRLSTVQMHRAGGVFVIPITLNDSVNQYAILDSGASNVQIPQEVADELRRNGSLTDADGLGQRRYILADGRGVLDKVFRLRRLKIGDKVMDNVVATISAPNTRILLGQSVLRRLNGWAIDNIKNTLTLD